MATPDNRDPFTVTCDAGFDEIGIWQIDCHVSWRDGIVPPTRSALLGEGRAAMVHAIAKAGHQGRLLGATRLRCLMQGHRPGGEEFVIEPHAPPEGDPEA